MRHDHPDWPTNPYPDAWGEITAFAYRTALSLIRPLNTVPFRLGEDGDYVLQHPFEADYQIDGGEWRRLTVPQGLITDLTSVPRPLRSLVGRVGPWQALRRPDDVERYGGGRRGAVAAAIDLPVHPGLRERGLRAAQPGPLRGAPRSRDG